jgi:hypothetical protein
MAMGDCVGDGNGNSNGIGDGNGDGNGNGNGDGVGDGDEDGNGDGNGDCHGKGNRYKGRVASSVAEMWSTFGGTTPCLHPHRHKGKCIHQRCIMGVTLLSVFASLQGGGFLTAHHELFFVYFLQLLFSLLNNPLFVPLHYSGAQEPCQPIDALSPPLLQEPRQPIDNLPRLLLHFLSR